MNVRYGLLAGIVLLGALAGCGDAEPPSGSPPTTIPVTTVPATPSPSLSDASVTVERTGGFVGVEQSVVVEPDGRWTYRRTRAGAGGGTPQTGRLTDAERTELQGLLANPRLSSEEAVSGECADGFEYTLVTGPTNLHWVDCGTGAPATAGKIVELLTDATGF
jgi:hypothetical protein